jgi:hypothetical protein
MSIIDRAMTLAAEGFGSPPYRASGSASHLCRVSGYFQGSSLEFPPEFRPEFPREFSCKFCAGWSSVESSKLGLPGGVSSAELSVGVSVESSVRDSVPLIRTLIP